MQASGTCGAKTRAGTPCRRLAGFATPHPGRGRCRAHGGLSPRAIVAAERAELLAEAKRWADDHDADPGELMLGLEDRRQRLAERQADLLAAAITDGLCEAFGDLATVERRSVFADVVTRRLLVLESREADELEQLRHRTPTLTGGTT
jgi:hypothetical protein